MTRNLKTYDFYDKIKTLKFHQKAHINIIYLLKTQNKALKKYDMS